MNNLNHTKSHAEFIAWRFYFSLFIILLVVIGLVTRIFYLSIWDKNFLRQEGDDRVLRLSVTPAFRGMILDRNGFPLAVSTATYSAFTNPQKWQLTNNEVVKLARIVNIKPAEINAMVKHSKEKKRSFLYLKRSLSPQIANEIKTLQLPNIYLQTESRRFYPEGEVFSHIIGFTNLDDNGQEGLELLYNDWLKGNAGKQLVMKDRKGRVIDELASLAKQKTGSNLILSVDRRIQYLAYRELLISVLKNKASSGSVVVLDVKTGEILAMANYPSYNPNNRNNINLTALRNRAVTDVFEPGSTIKAFSIASALDSGQFNLQSVVDIAPGWLRVGRNIVRDEHYHKDKHELSLGEILQVSSNVGVAKIILSLPKDQLWNVLSRVGFGEPTGILFPAEQQGLLAKHHLWGDIALATLGFGYGLSVTPLQLARAYAVFANHGRKLPLSLLRVEQIPEGEQVLTDKISQQMLSLLEGVVSQDDGTGKAGRIHGYRIAGKTGTAWKAQAGGYNEKRYVASFVGIAPASRPRYVVAVMINEPKGKNYYGSLVAAPVFKKVMEGILQLNNVQPDAV